MVCCSAGDETVTGLRREKQKEMGRSVDSLLSFLAGVVCVVVGSYAIFRD